MLGRLLSLFSKKPTLVQGAGALPEGESKKITLGDPLAGSGRDVIIAKVDGKLYAMDSRCPHAGGYITDGPLREGKYTNCPLHNYNFDPKNGDCVNAPCGKAKVFRTETEGQDLKIFL